MLKKIGRNSEMNEISLTSANFVFNYSSKPATVNAFYNSKDNSIRKFSFQRFN